MVARAVLVLGVWASAAVGTAWAANPVHWQVFVGPEAVLTHKGGARVPFSENSNPSPALRPTELFPVDAKAGQKDVRLRGKVRLHMTVYGFEKGTGAEGTQTATYEVALDELPLERVDGEGGARWRIPRERYAQLLRQLRESGEVRVKDR